MRRLELVVIAGAALCATAACKHASTAATAEEPTATFSLRSSAFADGQPEPAKYTCEGENLSPPLEWSGFPASTKSFALIVDDPDAPDPSAPQRTFVHWVVYGIPAGVTSIPEGGPLPAGAAPGTNDFGKTAYGGLCPPIGRHRYFHKLYALDVVLGGLDAPTKADLESAMRGHVLGTGVLVGTYQKTK